MAGGLNSSNISDEIRCHQWRIFRHRLSCFTTKPAERDSLIQKFRIKPLLSDVTDEASILAVKEHTDHRPDLTQPSNQQCQDLAL
eukprot:scaffold1184_cov132-Cylindrotheca_fusiformis.AAC.104